MKRPSDDQMKKELLNNKQIMSNGTWMDTAVNLANWAMDQVENEPVRDCDHCIYHPRNGLNKHDPKMEGVLTFGEWWKTFIYGMSEPIDVAKKAWEVARQGMIPAANAIQPPPESEWKTWATGIGLVFLGEDGRVVPNSLFKTIPRSKPAWKPKDWEPVFYLSAYSDVLIGAAYDNVDVVTIKKTDGTFYDIKHNRCKPFDATKIGKPWSEL